MGCVWYIYIYTHVNILLIYLLEISHYSNTTTMFERPMVWEDYGNGVPSARGSLSTCYKLYRWIQPYVQNLPDYTPIQSYYPSINRRLPHCSLRAPSYKLADWHYPFNEISIYIHTLCIYTYIYTMYIYKQVYTYKYIYIHTYIYIYIIIVIHFTHDIMIFLVTRSPRTLPLSLWMTALDFTSEAPVNDHGAQADGLYNGCDREAIRWYQSHPVIPIIMGV